MYHYQVCRLSSKGIAANFSAIRFVLQMSSPITHLEKGKIPDPSALFYTDAKFRDR
jgi:hypothetical protein